MVCLVVGGGKGGADVETGPGSGNGGEKPADPNRPQVDEIIPVYRRDCHDEVHKPFLRYSQVRL